MALAMVISSAYSKSAPTGSPKAILETFMPNGLMSFVKYKLVASPQQTDSEQELLLLYFHLSICLKVL